MAAAKRSPRCLDEAEPRLGHGLRESPRERCELTVQGEDAHRRLHPQRALPLPSLFLNRADRVLKARVVELHHMSARGALAGKPFREVHMDDVKAARPQPEIASLHVDDQLISNLARAEQSDIDD